MTKYDDIYEEAADNFGLITSKRASELGISNNEMVQYAKRGRIERVGQGVYRLTQRVPETNDMYALAVALVGPNAYLFGESVIAMLSLAPTNPNQLYVATTKRVRKHLPDGLIVVQRDQEAIAQYDGIPSQTVENAIRSCFGKMMPERLAQATTTARQEGYIDKKQQDCLLKELGN